MRTYVGEWHSRTNGRLPLTQHDPARLDAAAHDPCGLRVAFDWQTDRYSHQLFGLIDGCAVPLLASCEGTANDRWPASPPFQQLSVEEGAGGERIAFLVGMAGQSHWSASVQVSVGVPRAEFDVACLAREPACDLGSAYRSQVVPHSADARRITFPLPSGYAAELTVADIEEEACAELRVDSLLTTIACRELEKTTPFTFRWKYSVSVKCP